MRVVHAPVAFDWVEVVVVREGTGSCVHAEAETSIVGPGSVVFLMSNVPCAVEPDGQVTVTRVFFALDWLVEQVRWQHRPFVPDAWSAMDLAERLYPEQSQVIHVGSPVERALMAKTLDTLTGLTETKEIVGQYYSALSAASAVLSLVAPKLKRADTPRPVRRAVLVHEPTMACMATIRPTTGPVRLARKWIVAHVGERWTADDVASIVGVSASHFRRLFRRQMGKTPMAFRDAVRVRRMVGLLLRTDRTVAGIAAEVGWVKADQAIRVFQRAVGVTPSRYRESFRSRLREPGRYPDPIDSYPDPITFEH
jgi:AraC-like DNA-binding protein